MRSFHVTGTLWTSVDCTIETSIFVDSSQDRFFPNRLPRIVACLSLVWTASALSGPLIGGAFATAGLWRFAFWSFALQGLVLAAAMHLLLARAEPGSALHVRRVPVARLAFVGGAILAISLAGAIGSISVPRIEGTIR